MALFFFSQIHITYTIHKLQKLEINTEIKNFHIEVQNIYTLSTGSALGADYCYVLINWVSITYCIMY